VFIRNEIFSPQTALYPTPLRGHKIVPILTRRPSAIAFPIYRGGAADAQSVGRRFVPFMMLLAALLSFCWHIAPISSHITVTLTR
jgi:hypothetical protein